MHVFSKVNYFIYCNCYFFFQSNLPGEEELTPRTSKRVEYSDDDDDDDDDSNDSNDGDHEDGDDYSNDKQENDASQSKR